jgi:hypothetical protein
MAAFNDKNCAEMRKIAHQTNINIVKSVMKLDLEKEKMGWCCTLIGATALATAIHSLSKAGSRSTDELCEELFSIIKQIIKAQKVAFEDTASFTA